MPSVKEALKLTTSPQTVEIFFWGGAPRLEVIYHAAFATGQARAHEQLGCRRNRLRSPMSVPFRLELLKVVSEVEGQSEEQFQLIAASPMGLYRVSSRE